MAYTMKNILIALIALLAFSMAVVARPEKEECAAMIKAHEDPKKDPELQCRIIVPTFCTPSVEEAEWALDLLSSQNENVFCCHGGEFPNCNTPVSTPNIAIQVCGNVDVACTPCKDVADALRPVLKQCQLGGKVEGLVKERSLTFAISHPPSIGRACPF